MSIIKTTLVAAVFSLGLTACQTVNPKPSPVIDLLPDNVQALVVKSCGIILSTKEIQKLLSLFNPGIDTITSFVQGICSSITVMGRDSGKVYGTFRGVRFEGRVRR